MITVGIDFGASKLRVAVAEDGQAAQMLNLRYLGDSMPLLIAPPASPATPDPRHGPGQPTPAPGEQGLKITSLKRTLDFEQAVKLPAGHSNTMDILSRILRNVREECTQDGADHGLNCVAVVPPCFSQRQRSALRTATQRAGFARVRLVDDNLAALLTKQKEIPDGSSVLVYSWGASAFSVSQYQAIKNTFHVTGQEGDRQLGGDDIDTGLMNWVLKRLPCPEQDWQGSLEFLDSLAREIRRAKRALSQGEPAGVRWESLPVPMAGVFRRTPVVIPPHRFAELLAPMLERTLQQVDRVLAAGKGAKPGLILLMGGMAQIPEVGAAVGRRLESPCTLLDDNAVAIGAVRYGQSISPEEWAQTAVAGSEPAATPPRSVPGWTGGSGERPAPGQPRPAIDEYGERVLSLLSMARQHDAQNRLPQAIDAMETLLDDLTRLSAEMCRKAASQVMADGRLEEAVRLLAIANHRDPANRFVAVDLARASAEHASRALAQGKATVALDAVNAALKALTRLPDVEKQYSALLAEMYFLQGSILCKQGDWERAEKPMLESARLNPGQPVYREWLQQIRTNVRKLAGRGSLSWRRPERNKPCPCGSGKKYKQCCGR